MITSVTSGTGSRNGKLPNSITILGTTYHFFGKYEIVLAQFFLKFNNMFILRRNFLHNFYPLQP